MRCRRQDVTIRRHNRLAWEIFAIALGETAGFSDNPIDLNAVLTLARVATHRELVLETVRRVKILAMQFREVKSKEREAEESRAEMLDDLKAFTGAR